MREHTPHDTMYEEARDKATFAALAILDLEGHTNDPEAALRLLDDRLRSEQEAYRALGDSSTADQQKAHTQTGLTVALAREAVTFDPKGSERGRHA